MRKPKVGDKWRLSWMKHKPVKEIESFSPIWYQSRGCAVPAVWFYHAPKGKTITCSVRFLLENGELVKPANTARTPTDGGLSASDNESNPATIGG